MQGREIIILQRRIAALEQYNQYLLERNEILKGLVKKYIKFLEDLQSNLNKPKFSTTLIIHKEEGEEEYEKIR